MTEKLDLRVVRTKRLIDEAFLELLKVKGLSALTVRDLTEKAGINRGTFYLHYQDICDLIERTEMMKDLMDIFKPLDLADLLNHNAEREPFGAIMNAFTHLYEHANFFKAIFDPKGSKALGERLKFLMGTRMYESVNPESLNTVIAEVPHDFLISYMGAAQFGLIEYWFASGMTHSPREMALMVTRLIQNGPLRGVTTQ